MDVRLVNCGELVGGGKTVRYIITIVIELWELVVDRESGS